MSRDSWDDDAGLLADLGRALAEEAQTPDRVRDIGRAAFTWRTVDAELIELASQDVAGELVRGTGELVRFTFTGPGCSVELELDGDTVRGQLVPPGPGRVVLLGAADGPREVPVSDDGYFVVRDRPAGSARLQISTAAGGFRTPWFEPGSPD